MGMFDEVEYKGNIYQTKEFDCIMEQYRITDDGKLQRELCRIEDTPRAEKPYPDATKDDLEYFVGCRRKIHTGWENVDFHGVFRGIGDDGQFYFKFTDGKLVEVKKIDDG